MNRRQGLERDGARGLRLILFCDSSALVKLYLHEEESPAMQARQRFAAHWPQLFSLELTPSLAELAGDCADVFALRAHDSVQLAAVYTAQREFPGRVAFASHDPRLLKAARVLGIGSVTARPPP